MKRTSLPLPRRREFIAWLSSAATWPTVARAQPRDGDGNPSLIHDDPEAAVW
jgi:hypothetical protein